MKAPCRPFDREGVSKFALPLFRELDLRQRDHLLAVLFRDRPFGVHFLRALADVRMEVLRDLIVFREDDLFLAVSVLRLDRHLAAGGFFQITFGAARVAGDLGLGRLNRKAQRGNEGGSEECDFFHDYVLRVMGIGTRGFLGRSIVHHSSNYVERRDWRETDRPLPPVETLRNLRETHAGCG